MRAFIGIVVMFWPAVVAAEFYNGSALHDLCSQDRAATYIAGFIDKAQQDDMATFLFMPGEESGTRTTAVREIGNQIKGCLPQKATLGQLNDIVCEYVKNNPKARTAKTGSAMIRFALVEAFPCWK